MPPITRAAQKAANAARTEFYDLRSGRVPRVLPGAPAPRALNPGLGSRQRQRRARQQPQPQQAQHQPQPHQAQQQPQPQQAQHQPQAQQTPLQQGQQQPQQAQDQPAGQDTNQSSGPTPTAGSHSEDPQSPARASNPPRLPAHEPEAEAGHAPTSQPHVGPAAPWAAQTEAADAPQLPDLPDYESDDAQAVAPFPSAEVDPASPHPTRDPPEDFSDDEFRTSSLTASSTAEYTRLFIDRYARELPEILRRRARATVTDVVFALRQRIVAIEFLLRDPLQRAAYAQLDVCQVVRGLPSSYNLTDDLERFQALLDRARHHGAHRNHDVRLPTHWSDNQWLQWTPPGPLDVIPHPATESAPLDTFNRLRQADENLSKAYQARLVEVNTNIANARLLDNAARSLAPARGDSQRPTFAQHSKAIAERQHLLEQIGRSGFQLQDDGLLFLVRDADYNPSFQLTNELARIGVGNRWYGWMWQYVDRVHDGIPASPPARTPGGTPANDASPPRSPSRINPTEPSERLNRPPINLNLRSEPPYSMPHSRPFDSAISASIDKFKSIREGLVDHYERMLHPKKFVGQPPHGGCIICVPALREIFLPRGPRVGLDGEEGTWTHFDGSDTLEDEEMGGEGQGGDVDDGMGSEDMDTDEDSELDVD